MSTFQSNTICPNCKCNVDYYQDNNGLIEIECLHCGLHIIPTITYHTLDKLNEIRIQRDLKPLKQVRKQVY